MSLGTTESGLGTYLDPERGETQVSGLVELCWTVTIEAMAPNLEANLEAILKRSVYVNWLLVSQETHLIRVFITQALNIEELKPLTSHMATMIPSSPRWLVVTSTC